VLIRKPVSTLEFDHDAVHIGAVFADSFSLVDDGICSLSGDFDAAQPKLFGERPLVYLLKKACAKRIRNLEHGAQDLLSQRVDFIRR
jgi:hypothetical protein